MVAPFIPQPVNDWISSPNGMTMMQRFPLNLAAENLLPPEIQRQVFRFIQDNYIWPQVCERQSFEPLWDKVLRLARINLEDIDLNFALDTNAGKEQLTGKNGSVRVSDSCIFDAIDRLANINHFISWKDGLPMQFVVPEFVRNPYETDVYSPSDDRCRGGNALLDWNASNENYYLKHLISCRHHYTYGISLARSEFVLQVKMMPRQNNMGQIIMRPEVTRIGTTFDPLSVRRCWMNYRIPAHQMEFQPCPFYFEEMPYFATLQNTYNPDTNPFGFVNLDKLTGNRTYLYSSAETQSVRKAMEDRLNQIGETIGRKDITGSGLAQVLRTEYSVDALWTMYPMLPLDPDNGAWEKYPDGRPVPMVRYIVQTYGSNLATNQVLLRLQRNFYPRDGLPIYGSAHMPDLDSGMYAPCLGELLFNHYKEIVTCTNQFIANKDWINDPPAWVTTSSPSQDEDLTRKGAKLKVNGGNDFGWRQPYDATTSTVSMRNILREEVQTTSKAVDAILGKAMGGRTSATEASNAYQASMSGITTDINLFNHGISGGYAQRVWDYSALWFDPNLLEGITGQFGFVLKPEDMWLSIGIKTNVGSAYIASIVRQQNLRYVAESTVGDPSANRPNILLELFRELKLGNPKKLVIDGGFELEVTKATMQAQRTYLGEPVMVSPDQNHQLAMKVKTAFIEDTDSWFNKEHPEGIQPLIEQIKIHQQFAMLQMQAQMAMQQLNAMGGSGGPVDPSMMGGGANMGLPASTPGAANQTDGGLIPSA
jgi:hypothetical protein